MLFHQDWTDKVIEAVANNLHETGNSFFFLPPEDQCPSPPLLQPIPAAFLMVGGTFFKCKFMADEDFRLSMKSLCPLKI